MNYQWDLTDIYPGFDSSAFQSDFAALSVSAEKMNNLADNLSNFDDAALLVKELERYLSLIDRVFAYGGCVFSTNTSDQNANKYLYKAEEINAETSRVQVRLSVFLAEQDKKGDLDMLAEAHGLGAYTYRLRKMAEQYGHMMSESEETLASRMSATGSSAWSMMHDKLISMLTCDYADPKENGKIRTVTLNECRNLAYDADARVRKAAYEAELAACAKIAEASAASLNGIKGEVNLLTRLRNYARPLDHTLFESGMTQKTLDAMFAAIDDNIQSFRNYLKAKAKYLAGQSGTQSGGLPFYDLFAPVGISSDKEFTYEDAKKFVTDNFARFSPKMAQTAQYAFDHNWIDVYPREGKTGGAFCVHIHSVKQFRNLLNFGGSISDAVTMAHELGHGYHAMNIMEESILNGSFPMPLAETASTFAENVVNRAVLSSLENDGERLRMLENSLQDSTQVIVDIYSRFLFERSVFETRIDHPLSVEELNSLMLAAQKTAYGDGLDPAFLHPYMWAVKSHYYSGSLSFYNFPYAFGHLLANGLYKIYESDPASFGSKYDTFLRNTGKMSVKDVCAALGIDVEDKAFWDEAIDVLKENIAEFERLVG